MDIVLQVPIDDDDNSVTYALTIEYVDVPREYVDATAEPVAFFLYGEDPRDTEGFDC